MYVWTHVYPYIYLYSAPERHPRSTSMNQKYKKTTAKEDDDKEEEQTQGEGGKRQRCTRWEGAASFDVDNDETEKSTARLQVYLYQGGTTSVCLSVCVCVGRSSILQKNGKIRKKSRARCMLRSRVVVVVAFSILLSVMCFFSSLAISLTLCCRQFDGHTIDSFANTRQNVAASQSCKAHKHTSTYTRTHTHKCGNIVHKLDLQPVSLSRKFRGALIKGCIN